MHEKGSPHVLVIVVIGPLPVSDHLLTVPNAKGWKTSRVTRLRG